MSFISGTFVGATFIADTTPEFIKSLYDKVTIYGSDSYPIFDKLWIRNIVDDSTYFEDLVNFIDYQPTFDANTVFFADFDNGSLSAGNVSAGGEDAIAWRVTKTIDGRSQSYLVGEFPISTTQAVDYRVRNGETYKYEITAKTATKLAQPLETETIIAEHYGLFLIDEETNLCINFDMNGVLGNMSAEGDYTSYKTFNQFNTVSIGAKNALKGTISGIVNENSSYCDGVIQSADFIDLIQDYVNNGTKKLLKTRKGDIFEIATSNFSRSQFVNESRQQVDVVSFDFEQIERVESA